MDKDFKCVGIIAEYNPFHRGHEYHIRKAKEETNAKYCVVVMSGDFLQRGEPAIVNKYVRTQMALKAGADLVIELPVRYSSSSAEFFATAAVSILNNLGVVDYISFGSECGDSNALERIADVLLEEPGEYNSELSHQLKNGHSYPLARNMALAPFVKDIPNYMDILSSPNNILGIEYIKALKRTKSSIKPTTILRAGSGYHGVKMSDAPDTHFSSALAIRTCIEEADNLSAALCQLPENVQEIFENAFITDRAPIYRNDFSALLHYKLLSCQKQGYTVFGDVSKELSDRIANKLKDYTNYSDFCDLLKTKDITYARVSRALLHILLDLKEDRILARDINLPYADVLGFNKESSEMLSAIKAAGSIALITKRADAQKLIPAPAYKYFEETLLASNIYECTVMSKFKTQGINPITMSPITK